ncbi:hypothetical protein SEPCBS119000_000233 [Sporothrix epigloea]|uniref:Delta(3,5)-Delta(2,4)-dienoyl-CoA isomerase n=1 Tax=Sporothrix epigloea TaxID=1892477 RepID=A0ABP0D6S6_9PEZI
MEFKYILVTKPSDYVAHVELNRPNKLNAFIPQLWIELGQAFTQLSTDAEVRAIVLSGAGERAFTTGLDVVSAAEYSEVMANLPDTARRAAYMRRHILEMQASLNAVERCEKPVICVLHGLSLGLAVDLACCADVRLCSSDTRFAVKEVDIGLAADLGSLARLPKLVANHSWVYEVSLTAREFNATEAQAVGFVSHVLPNKAAALAYGLDMAAQIASKSPVAVQGTKELLHHGRDHPIAESLKYTAVWNAAAVQSDDVQSALMSGLNKTKPHFAKL